MKTQNFLRMVTKGNVLLRYLCLLLWAFPAGAADQITLTVTVTNTTLPGDYLTFNADTRRWTNGTPSPLSTWIATNSTAAATATNLYQHLATYPFQFVRIAYADSNVVTLTAPPGITVTATAATNWATLALSTNAVTEATVIRVPMSTVTAALRTNLAAQLVSDLSAYSTNAIDDASTMASELAGLSNVQTVTGSKTFSGTNGTSFPVVALPTAAETNTFRFSAMTNSSGMARPVVTDSLGMSNVVAVMPLTNSSGVPYYSSSTKQLSVLADFNISSGQELILGNSDSTNDWRIRFWQASEANKELGDLLWYSIRTAGPLHAQEYAQITGWMVTTNAGTESGALRFDTAAGSENILTLNLEAGNVYVPGTFTVTNNTTLQGTLAVTGASTLTGAAAVVGGVTAPSVVATNTVNTGTLTVNTNASIAGVTTVAEQRWPVYANSGLAAGANAAVALGGKSYVRLSGPTGAFSIAGVAGGADGRMVILENVAAYDMTILNESGLESTAGNRVLTGAVGGDIAIASGACVSLVYNAGSSRWKVASHGNLAGVVLATPEWDDVRIPLASTRAGAAAPTATTWIGTTRGWAFDAGTENSMEFELQIPHGISTNDAYGLRMHLHWSSLAIGAGAATNVVWGIEYNFANPSQVFPATSTTVLVTNGIDVARAHRIATMFTLTGIKESGVMVGRIYRAAASGSDTHTAVAFPLSLDAHYPRIRFGSTNEMGDF
jgi:hypothetical protein